MGTVQVGAVVPEVLYAPDAHRVEVGAVVPEVLYAPDAHRVEVGATVVEVLYSQSRVYARGCTFRNGGEDVAIPLISDRAAYRVTAYPARHSDDLLAHPQHHVPLPGVARQVAISDGTDWTSRALVAADIPAEYVRLDGTLGLTAPWDAGAHMITAEQLESDIVTGTAPLIVASTTVVTNLNADLLDGQHGAYYAPATAIAGTAGRVAQFAAGGAAVEDANLIAPANLLTLAATVPATLTIPESGTVGLLGTAQTWTAVNTFNENILQADAKYISTDEVRARDGDGLKLYDDGGNGIFVKDGGFIGNNKSLPLGQYHIQSSGAAVIGQIIQLATSPSANALEIRAVGTPGAVLANITQGGGARYKDAQIGDGTNYTEIKTDGEILRHGTARTTNGLWIAASGLKAPGSKPATYVAHGITGVWSFADENVAANQQTVSGAMRIADRMDRSATPVFRICWSADETVGNAEWQLEYLWRSPNESTEAAAQETLTQTAACSATSNGLIVTAITGVDIPSATDVCLHFRIKRLSAGGNDTIADAIQIIGTVLDFTSNKLGAAT